MATIYKIFRLSEYETFVADGVTDGAPIDLSDGYIHFSTAEQVRETAEKHFSGAGDLKLLAVDVAELGDDLQWEPSRGGDLFPHLYRPLRRDDVLWSRDLPFVDGAHQFGDLDP